MNTGEHVRRLLVIIVLLAAAAFLLLPIERPGFSVVSFDTYAYFYVNVLHALRAVHDGGRGLLWNPWQNCGQPFFAISMTGLLYPPHLLFLLFGPDLGLRAVTVVDLAVAGLGAYALACEFGLSRAAALASALAFQFGNSTLLVATWAPMISGPYVWFPFAMLLCERLLDEASVRRVCGLALVLTLALLPGYPQIVLFIYLLIGLRVAWALLLRECARPLRCITAFGAALTLPLFLAAAQLLPSIEFAAESVRNAPVAEGSKQLAGTNWATIATGLAQRNAALSPFLLAGSCLAAASLGIGRARRPLAAFYLLAGLIFFALAFGPGSPLFDLYARLPFATMFRFPRRFLWPADFCLSVLVGFGVEALSARGGTSGALRRAVPVGLAAVTALVFAFVIPGGLAPAEWGALSPLLLAALATALPLLAPAVGPLLVLSILLNAALAPVGGLFRWHPSDGGLRWHAPLFEDLRRKISPQYRLMLVTRGDRSFALIQKTATVFEAAAIYDYEPQMSRRYADYFSMMRVGRPATLADAYFAGLNWLPAGTNRRLFDLTGARYVVAALPLEGPAAPFSSRPLLPLQPPKTYGWRGKRIRLYENPSAGARASYVSRVEIVPDPLRLLRRLATGREDLHELAFVEAAPASGFVGAEGEPARGSAAIVLDEPEHVVAQVEAPAPGFLLLADQYYAGWEASVNSQPAEILRANYVFRLVEVPQGTSRVEFRFRPRSLAVGAAVSLLTSIVMAVACFRRAPKQRQT